MSAGWATWIEALSAAFVGIVSLGAIVGWIVKKANELQAIHITTIVAEAVEHKLQPIKETVGEKNGDGDLAQMNARTLAETGQILRGLDRTLETQEKLIELHDYSHREIHRLNGMVGMMWADWAKQHGIDIGNTPPPAPSPKD